MKRIVIAMAGIMIFAGFLISQTTELEKEGEAIKAAALDYMEGAHEGNADRIARSVHTELCNYREAESCFLAAINFQENKKVPDYYNLIKIYTNLGNFYSPISLCDLSIEYVTKAEQLIEINSLNSQYS